jgi:chaperone modulatory protein CbpM
VTVTTLTTTSAFGGGFPSRPRGKSTESERVWMSLAAFARATQLHPDVVRRFVALGLLDAARDAAGELRFPPSQLAAAARLARLRAGFSLNYAALGLIAFLLDRIAELEQKGPGRGR